MCVNKRVMFNYVVINTEQCLKTLNCVETSD